MNIYSETASYYFTNFNQLQNSMICREIFFIHIVVSSCIVLLSVSRVYSLRWSIGHRICASGEGGASVCLSRGVGGSSFAPHPHSCCFWVRSLWAASVEPANVHPTVFLTPGAFYIGFSGLLRDSDSRSSRWSRLSVCILFSWLSSTETPHLCISGALSGLPETITQLELQSSSFALTRLFRH